MAKITRVFQKIFASSAPGSGNGTVGEFGSLAAGTPTASTDVATIQSLSAWVGGWLSAIIGDNGPPLEDMNGFCFVVTTQLAYLFQQGIPEWDATTAYYTGSKVNVSGTIYTSLTDNNVNHAVTDTTNWAVQGRNTKNVAVDTTMDPAVDYYRVDATAGAITMTLPAIASNLNKVFKVKKIDSSANVVTVKGHSSELIDFANTFPLENGGDSVDVTGQAAIWDIT